MSKMKLSKELRGKQLAIILPSNLNTDTDYITTRTQLREIHLGYQMIKANFFASRLYC